MKSGDDPTFQVQSVKSAAKEDVVITRFSSQPTVITLSPSPTAGLEEQQEPSTSHLTPKSVEQESDKESDSE